MLACKSCSVKYGIHKSENRTCYALVVFLQLLQLLYNLVFFFSPSIIRRCKHLRFFFFCSPAKLQLMFSFLFLIKTYDSTNKKQICELVNFLKRGCSSIKNNLRCQIQIHLYSPSVETVVSFACPLALSSDFNKQFLSF